MQALPVWFRKFLVDFIETGIGAILALQLALPANTDAAVRLAAVLGGAVFGALVSAFRRAVPGLVAWLRDVLAVQE